MQNDNPDIAIDIPDDEYTPLISAEKSTKNSVILIPDQIKICQQIITELKRMQVTPYLAFGSKVTLSILICGGLISAIAMALAPVLGNINLERTSYLMESEEKYQFIYSEAVTPYYASVKCATDVRYFSAWPALCNWNPDPSHLTVFGQWIYPCNTFLSEVCQTNQQYNRHIHGITASKTVSFIMLLLTEFFLLFYLTWQLLQNRHQFDAIAYLFSKERLSTLQHKLIHINMTIPQGISCSELIKKLVEKKEVLINDHTVKWPRRLAFLAGMLDSSINTPLHDIYFNAFRASDNRSRFFHSPEITRKIFNYADLLPRLEHSPVA